MAFRKSLELVAELSKFSVFVVLFAMACDEPKKSEPRPKVTEVREPEFASNPLIAITSDVRDFLHWYNANRMSFSKLPKKGTWTMLSKRELSFSSFGGCEDGVCDMTVNWEDPEHPGRFHGVQYLQNDVLATRGLAAFDGSVSVCPSNTTGIGGWNYASARKLFCFNPETRQGIVFSNYKDGHLTVLVFEASYITGSSQARNRLASSLRSELEERAHGVWPY